MPPLCCTHHHGRQVTCLDWSADGKRLATGAQDGTLKLWRIDEACGVREPGKGTGLGAGCVPVCMA